VSTAYRQQQSDTFTRAPIFTFAITGFITTQDQEQGDAYTMQLTLPEHGLQAAAQGQENALQDATLAAFTPIAIEVIVWPEASVWSLQVGTCVGARKCSAGNRACYLCSHCN
jgi:hypothetical protein